MASPARLALFRRPRSIARSELQKVLTDLSTYPTIAAAVSGESNSWATLTDWGLRHSSSLTDLAQSPPAPSRVGRAAIHQWRLAVCLDFCDILAECYDKVY